MALVQNCVIPFPRAMFFFSRFTYGKVRCLKTDAFQLELDPFGLTAYVHFKAMEQHEPKSAIGFTQ